MKTLLLVLISYWCVMYNYGVNAQHHLSAPVISEQSSGAPSQKPNEARGDGYFVEATIVQPQPSAQVLFRIKVRYEFKDQTQILIHGLGQFSPKGELSFLTTEKKLDFLDLDGKIITTVHLKPNRQATEGGVTELPDEKQFTDAEITGTSLKPLTSASMMNILNKWFSSGSRPRQEKETTIYISTYRYLGGLPNNLVAQLAVIVSFPARPKNGQGHFSLKYLVRERRAKSGISDWIYEKQYLDTKTREKAVEEINTIIQEIKGP